MDGYCEACCGKPERGKDMAVEVLGALDKFMDEMGGKLLKVKQMAGEKFRIDAHDTLGRTIYGRQVYDADGKPRSRRPWELTGNLISSVGYTVVQGGRVMTSDYKVVLSGGEGKKEGEAHARQIAAGQDDAIIANAGMDYAAAVEAKGYDVISGSAERLKQTYERLIKEMLKV